MIFKSDWDEYRAHVTHSREKVNNIILSIDNRKSCTSKLDFCLSERRAIDKVALPHGNIYDYATFYLPTLRTNIKWCYPISRKANKDTKPLSEYNF